MPELPEVETMRRGLVPIAGARIATVVRPPCKLRPIELSPALPALRRRIVGRTITAVERLGKRIVLRLDERDALVIEPRMTGLVLLTDPPDTAHLRLRMDLVPGTLPPRGRGPERGPRGGTGRRAAADAPTPPTLWFWDRRGLGTVRYVAAEEWAARYGPERLGPDALSLADGAALAARLRASRRAIKVALLDQRAVLGIGNLYASEMLHRAGLHPARRCTSLRADEWRRLHAALVEVLQEAIRYEGSTLSDGTYRNALNQSGSYQNQHRVYDRADEPCPDCGGTPIVRIVQAQRSTFFCPACQPRRPK